MDNRYVLRRVAGSWQVHDSEFGNFVMGEYGAGAEGHRRAQAVANGLNAQPHDAGESSPSPADNDVHNSGELSPLPADNDLRSSAGLRAWRHAHKLSQPKLAQLLEVHTMTVNRWETGQVPIPKTTELALLYLDHILSGWEPLSTATV